MARRGDIQSRPHTAKQREVHAQYKARVQAKLTASFAKLQPPKESWWALGLERERFYARAEQEYQARLKGHGSTGANTFD